MPLPLIAMSLKTHDETVDAPVPARLQRNSRTDSDETGGGGNDAPRRLDPMLNFYFLTIKTLW